MQITNLQNDNSEEILSQIKEARKELNALHSHISSVHQTIKGLPKPAARTINKVLLALVVALSALLAFLWFKPANALTMQGSPEELTQFCQPADGAFGFGNNPVFNPTDPGSFNLSQIGDVDITAAIFGDLLMYDGTNWVDTATSTLKVALSDTTGILAVSRGGTATSTFVNTGVLFFDGTTLTQDTSNFYYTNASNTLTVENIIATGSLQGGSLTVVGNVVGDLQISGDAYINGGQLDLGTGNATTTLTSAGGLFGIVDTSPTYQLDVTGDARFTSLIDASYFTATTTLATSTFQGVTLATSGGNVGIASSTPKWILSVNGSGNGFAVNSSGNIVQGGYTANIIDEAYIDADIARDTELPVGANPTGTIGLTAVNGSATTFLRSDGAPALSQAIQPTWSALHTFTGGVTLNNATSTTFAITGLATGAGTFLAVDPSGSVIATSTPSGASVAGSDGQVQYNNSSAFGGASNLIYDDTNNRIGIASTSPWGLLGVEQGSDNPSLVVANQGSSTPSLFIDNGGAFGRVGIGTASPSQPLTIRGTQEYLIEIQGTGSDNAWIAFSDNTTKEWHIGRLESNNAFAITETGANSPFTILASSGNVGIGTTTPAYLADVDGDLRVGIQGAATNFLLYANTTSNRVGIGTSTPGVLFSVQGSALIQSNLTIEGTVLQGTWNGTPISSAYIATDAVNDTHIDWGTGANQVSIADLSGNQVSGALVWDLGGATSFEIPNAANPSLSVAGQVAVNTTAASSSIEYYDGTANRAIYDIPPRTFTFSSTTMEVAEGLTASTTIPMGVASPHGETWTEMTCYTDVGTVELEWGDGTNWMDYQRLTTAALTDSSLSNNTFTMREKRSVRVGQASATFDWGTCTVGIRENTN